jgi:hypothetical protein
LLPANTFAPLVAVIPEICWVGVYMPKAAIAKWDFTNGRESWGWWDKLNCYIRCKIWNER